MEFNISELLINLFTWGKRGLVWHGVAMCGNVWHSVAWGKWLRRSKFELKMRAEKKNNFIGGKSEKVVINSFLGGRGKSFEGKFLRPSFDEIPTKPN